MVRQEALHRQRRSRWTREPVSGPAGEPCFARLTERDFQIFEALIRYRYLPVDYIHALVGGDYKALARRLNLLSRNPNRYVQRPDQQRQHALANSRPLIYQLDDRGVAAVRANGHQIATRESRRAQFSHDLMICQIAASLEIGVRADQRFSIIDWETIRSSGKVPAATLARPRPTAIPLPENKEVNPDWQPFVLMRKLTETSYIFFPGFEADCGTEPISTADTSRSSIHAKLSAYLTVIHRGIHRAHFGASTFMIPFITTSAARMNSMMSLLSRLQPGDHARCFLFKHIPSFTSHAPQAPATGHMLTQPWQRVGFDPFCLVS